MHPGRTKLLAITAIVGALGVGGVSAEARDRDAHMQESLTVTLMFEDEKDKRISCGKESVERNRLCYGGPGDYLVRARELGAERIRHHSTFDNGDWTESTETVPATDDERFTGVFRTSFNGRERTFKRVTSIDELRERAARVRAEAGR